MEVYHGQTPVRSMNQSIALFKSHQRAVYDELCKTRPKTFTNFGTNYARTYTQSYGVIPFLRDDSSPKKLGSPPKSLKKLVQNSPEPGGSPWDIKSLGLPISTFNERVHSSFRIGFNDLNHQAYQTVTPSSKKTSKYL